jgi:hypothetical protein
MYKSERKNNSVENRESLRERSNLCNLLCLNGMVALLTSMKILLLFFICVPSVGVRLRGSTLTLFFETPPAALKYSLKDAENSKC